MEILIMIMLALFAIFLFAGYIYAFYVLANMDSVPGTPYLAINTKLQPI